MPKAERVYLQARGAGMTTPALLSTAATSPEAKEYDVKSGAMLSGHGLETDRPARNFQADTPLSGARSAK